MLSNFDCDVFISYDLIYYKGECGDKELSKNKFPILNVHMRFTCRRDVACYVSHDFACNYDPVETGMLFFLNS